MTPAEKVIILDIAKELLHEAEQLPESQGFQEDWYRCTKIRRLSGAISSMSNPDLIVKEPE